MKYGEYTIAAAPLNGQPQRLVILERADGVAWRDQLNTNSSRSRKRFATDAASKLHIGVEELIWLDDAIVQAADQADMDADALITATTHLKEGMAHLDAMPEAVRTQARAMLESPTLIAEICADIESLGIVGERSLSLTLYLLGTSRLLDQPLSAIILGSSSTGKSFVLERVTSMFPSEAVVSATTLTPQALYYLPPESLKHRLVVVGERSRILDDSAAEATRALREMISSGHLRKLLPVKANGQFATQIIEQEGPISYVESTTLSLSEIFEEDVNRSLILSTDERPQQTARIIAALGRAYSGDAEASTVSVVSKHHAAQRMLQGREVVIPFAAEIAQQFAADRVEARRGFPHLMNLTRAVVLLHQFQRERDQRGRLVGTLDDFCIARQLATKPLGRLLGKQLSDAAASFLERLKLLRDSSEVFSTTGAVRGEAASRRSVQAWLLELSDHKAVECVEPSRGNLPARWRLTNDGHETTPWTLPDISECSDHQ